MRYVPKHYQATYEIKKSKFIAHIFPYDKFDTIMQQLKKEHTKARHFVYAYQYLNQFEQIVQNCSDDGEPKGTSGKPTLSVLSGANIINTAIITVRYFGGIKLGTGGLVKAYSDAANLVIKNSTLLLYEKLIQKQLTIHYKDLQQIQYLTNKYNITIKQQEFGEDINLILEGSKENFKLLFQNLPCRTIKITNLSDNIFL
jgi:uncharacterized YigZ family protein